MKKVNQTVEHGGLECRRSYLWKDGYYYLQFYHINKVKKKREVIAYEDEFLIE